MEILTADSVTALGGQHAGNVVVAGSHGGIIAGMLAARAMVHAVILNDAGVGKDEAGIASLALLEAIGMAAATVNRRSAPMGQGERALEAGVISHVNRLAAASGVRRGDACRDAAQKLRQAPPPRGRLPRFIESRHRLGGARGQPPVIGCDSVCLVRPGDAGKILVVGSHAALHAPDPRLALAVDACAAFFHDAGCLGEAEGISRLPVLDRRGMPVAAVDHRSARIGDARSMWESGQLSFLNEAAALAGWRRGMSLPEAVACYRATAMPARLRASA